MKARNRNVWRSVIMTLVCLKFAALGWCLFVMDPDDGAAFIPAMLVRDAKAQTGPASAEGTPGVPPAGDEFLEELKQRRMEQLRKREELIRIQSRLAQVEQERLDKAQEEMRLIIARMSTLGDRYDEKIAEIEVKLKEMQDLGGEQMAKLAKVFEETPPEQAGPMLTKLSPEMAAQILLSMSSRKAGRIWGQVGPEQGAKISQELARIQERQKIR